MKKNILVLIAIIFSAYALITFNSGCAQVGMPTGGAKDTVAPVLVKSNPDNYTVNFTGNKVTLFFDEYIDVKDLQSNLVVSPLPKNNPTVNNNLKTISIKFRDTLRPNTTYSVNFGNAVIDVHEGNILKNFTYTFSTGSYIDSLVLRGKALIAETGRPDSTLLLLLYKNAVDTSVTSRRPDYITKVDGEGNFKFIHLPGGEFRIYALKDGDGSKTYNGKTELFAFNDSAISTNVFNPPINLFAYAEEKAPPASPGAPAQKKPAEKKLRFSSSIVSKQQDILSPLEFTASNPLKTFDSSKIIVADTNYKPVPHGLPAIDSTRKKITFKINWQPETQYVFILPKEAFEDSAGNVPEKSDTVHFITKKVADYGSIVLRFKNIALAKHPVIEFLQADVIKFSFPVTTAEWSNKRFPPGDYDIRILYDSNNNGIWDPGSYKDKRQPEKAISLPQKLAIKADWENEREIQL